MKFFYIILFLFLLFGCHNKTFKKEHINTSDGFYIDTTYHFIDSLNNKIFIKTFFSADSNKLLSFKYFIKKNNSWQLINEYDSIPIPHGFNTDHADFNGDKIKDFVFLADVGGRGSNYFEHLFLFDTSKRSFINIRGFDQVCAPTYDSTEKTIQGTGLGGSTEDFRTYHIQKDSIIQVKGEVWEDGQLFKKYKIVDGKKIVTFKKRSK